MNIEQDPSLGEPGALMSLMNTYTVVGGIPPMPSVGESEVPHDQSLVVADSPITPAEDKE